MTITAIWLAALILIICVAAAMEWGAIRNQINGANGLILYMAGLLGLFSLPVGFGLLWWLASLQVAAIGTATVASVAGLLWRALLGALDRAVGGRRSADSP